MIITHTWCDQWCDSRNVISDFMTAYISNKSSIRILVKWAINWFHILTFWNKQLNHKPRLSVIKIHCVKQEDSEDKCPLTHHLPSHTHTDVSVSEFTFGASPEEWWPVSGTFTKGRWRVSDNDPSMITTVFNQRRCWLRAARRSTSGSSSSVEETKTKSQSALQESWMNAFRSMNMLI